MLLFRRSLLALLFAAVSSVTAQSCAEGSDCASVCAPSTVTSTVTYMRPGATQTLTRISTSVVTTGEASTVVSVSTVTQPAATVSTVLTNTLTVTLPAATVSTVLTNTLTVTQPAVTVTRTL